ncbi:helix-turn-helix transcriptional regulator [Actinoallomurus vinaceus]|uniref:helix-turn-helix transcriptional regulator n=1 Tax=Actinoallomurus vinaceus TaxID=1080074 RepID=UPI0031E81528
MGGFGWRDPAWSLIGREKEIEFVGSFVERAAVEGGALLLSGEAGVGKTALLEVAVARAKAAGVGVLVGMGAEFEAEVSFAGLHQLLDPVLDELPGLSPVHARALGVALGLRVGEAPAQLTVAGATLALLRHLALARPLLVVIDDLPWLDRASATVLGFVARRLAGHRVGLLAAARSGPEGFTGWGDLPELEVPPLDDAGAAALLAARFPALTPRVRQRLLAEAQGNPLALLELPVALAGPQHGALPAVLPLGRRLRAVFAARIGGLPEETRRLLLLAVLDGTGDLGVQGDTSGIAAAERAGLIRVVSGRLMFRHPLTRAAVVELSTIEQRRQAHRELAERLADQPARHAWHLAEAAEGPDERVAALLQDVAHANLFRGDGVGAIAELIRAAELSPGGTGRADRLAEAAYLGSIVTGDLQDAPRLLEAARRAAAERRPPLSVAVAGAYQLLNGDGDADTAHALLVAAIEGLDDPGDAGNKTLIEALYTLLMVCFFGGRTELWTPFHAAVDRLRPSTPELLDVLRGTFSDPVRLAAPTLGRLDAAIAGLEEEINPARAVRIGIAASYLDRLAGCRGALRRVVRDGRDGGAVTSAIEALYLLGNDALFTGQWEYMEEVTDEGLALCDAHGYRLLTWPGIFLRAVLAAVRGQEDVARGLTDQMTAWAGPRRLRAVHRYAAHTRTLMALGRGDFEDAYRHAVQVTPVGELASHVPQALWLVMELTEAAMRSGRTTRAAAHVAAARHADLPGLSPRLALVTAGAAAMADPDLHEHVLFEEAMAVPDADRWPFDLARIRLAFGERLRRVKATTEARAHLSGALEAFQRLGARPWAARAAAELRATGLSVGQTEISGPASLTPQQWEIARLAATGLTNKQIGERLFLSPRTVATHLYQLFPKLGVTSRAALRDALADHPSKSDD